MWVLVGILGMTAEIVGLIVAALVTLLTLPLWGPIWLIRRWRARSEPGDAAGSADGA